MQLILHIRKHCFPRDASKCTTGRYPPDLLIKVFIVFGEVIRLVLMGSWMEDSSEGGDMTKLICTQRLSKQDFTVASIK